MSGISPKKDWLMRSSGNNNVRSRSNSNASPHVIEHIDLAQLHTAHSTHHAHNKLGYGDMTPYLKDDTPQHSPIAEDGLHVHTHSFVVHTRHPHAPSQSTATLHSINSRSPPGSRTQSVSAAGPPSLPTVARSHTHSDSSEGDSSGSDDPAREVVPVHTTTISHAASASLSTSPPVPPVFHHRSWSLHAMRHRFSSSAVGRFGARVASFLFHPPASKRGRVARGLVLSLLACFGVFMSVNLFALSVRVWHDHFSTSCQGVELSRFFLPPTHIRHPSHCPASLTFHEKMAAKEEASKGSLPTVPGDAVAVPSLLLSEATKTRLEEADSLSEEQLVPNIVHYIYGLDLEPLPPFYMLHYISMASAFHVQRPEKIYLHYTHLPRGQWWDATVKLLGAKLVLRPVPRVDNIFGRPLYHPMHQGDPLRLQILLQFGGIFLDLDLVLVRSLDELRRYRLVLSEESAPDSSSSRVLQTLGGHGIGGWHTRSRGVNGIGNGMIIAEARNPFLAEWLSQYKTFDYLEWDYHCCQLPLLLAEQYPDELLTLPASNVYLPAYNQLQRFFTRNDWRFDDSWFVFLWHQLSEETHFKYVQRIAQMWEKETSFSRLARAALNLAAPIQSGTPRHRKSKTQT